MTEPLSPQEDHRLEDRVRSAFSSELGRAAADIRDGALTQPLITKVTAGPRSRTRARLAGVAAAVVVLAAVAGTLMLATSAPRPEQAATPGPSPTPSASLSRYDDGIPTEWQGQPVLRWAQALATARTMKDDSPFLAGVWIYTYPPGAVVNCPKGETPDPSWPDSWIDFSHCPAYHIKPNEDSDLTDLSNVVTFHFMAGGAHLETGPAILRIHVHDSRASLCGDRRPTCDEMLVVDAALWTGDAASDPKPLTLADVQAAVAGISAAGQHPDRIELPDGSLLSDDVAGLPGARDDYSFANAGQYAMQLMGVSVMQSTADVTKALPHSQPGADGALAPSSDWTTETYSGDGWSRDFSIRWLIVENVAVRLRLNTVPSEADGTFVRQLEAAIRARI